jgi:HPt (histidine-containing phosphotransfer) domain-containing protein
MRSALDKVQFDPEDLLDRVDADKDLFKEVIEIFLHDMPGTIAALGDRIAKQDAAAAEKIAHTIRGACATMSAKKLENLAHQLEKIARGKDLDGAEAAYRVIVQCFNQLRVQMQAVLKKMAM